MLATFSVLVFSMDIENSRRQERNARDYGEVRYSLVGM